MCPYRKKKTHHKRKSDGWSDYALQLVNSREAGSFRKGKVCQHQHSTGEMRNSLQTSKKKSSSFQKLIKKSVNIKGLVSKRSELQTPACTAVYIRGQKADTTAASRGQQTLLPQDLGPHLLPLRGGRHLRSHFYRTKDESEAILPQGKEQKILTSALFSL